MSARGRKSLLGLLALVLWAGPQGSSADQDGAYTYTVAGGQAIITAFDTAYSGALTITPSKAAAGGGEESKAVEDEIGDLGCDGFHG